MSEVPLAEVFQSQAVVLLRNGTTVSELYARIRAAEEQVAAEREANAT